MPRGCRELLPDGACVRACTGAHTSHHPVVWSGLCAIILSHDRVGRLQLARLVPVLARLASVDCTHTAADADDADTDDADSVRPVWLLAIHLCGLWSVACGLLRACVQIFSQPIFRPWVPPRTAWCGWGRGHRMAANGRWMSRYVPARTLSGATR